jgi:hypothetical protein
VAGGKSDIGVLAIYLQSHLGAPPHIVRDTR